MPVRDAWWEHMACRAADPEIFEEPPTPTGRAGHRDRWRRDTSWADEALSYCKRCPVQVRCLDEALRNHPEASEFTQTQRYVVGGVMPDAFDQLRHQRNRR
jgi:hypothetical protein